jgi:sigma-E factor negative regulatory protein RseB
VRLATAWQWITLAWMILLAASTPTYAITSEPALERLRAMATAVRSLSYSGKLVYQRADVLANLAFEHDIVAGEEVARLRRLSGSPVERAQRGQTLIEASPGPNVLRQGYPLPGLLNTDIRQVLVAPYRLSLESEERVADRLAQIVTVEALDGHRHSYRFWIDQESSLLLKSQTLNLDGQVLEQFEFSELALGPQEIEVAGGDESLQVRVYPVKKASSVLQFSPASWLPSGYQLVSALPSRAAGQRIYTLVYSDGLGSFSIFLELRNARAQPDMQAILGPTVALGKDYPLAGSALRVTLVGEIPSETGRTIIEALDVDGLKGLLSRTQ